MLIIVSIAGDGSLHLHTTRYQQSADKLHEQRTIFIGPIHTRPVKSCRK